MTQTYKQVSLFKTYVYIFNFWISMLNWLQNAFSSQVIGKIVSGKKNTSFNIKSRKLLCLIAIKEYSSIV